MENSQHLTSTLDERYHNIYTGCIYDGRRIPKINVGT